MRKSWIFLAMLAFAVGGCADDAGISEVPEIEFVSATPQTVIAYQDSLVVTISYRDGDGDLGENDTDQNNLFLEDSRNGVVYGFRIRQLAPDDATIAIEGNLNVTMPNVPIIGSGNTESLNYSIWVVDRAGNESERVSSSAITVNR
jgi:hypothetical protein